MSIEERNRERKNCPSLAVHTEAQLYVLRTVASPVYTSFISLLFAAILSMRGGHGDERALLARSSRRASPGNGLSASLDTVTKQQFTWTPLPVMVRTSVKAKRPLPPDYCRTWRKHVTKCFPSPSQHKASMV